MISFTIIILTNATIILTNQGEGGIGGRMERSVERCRNRDIEGWEEERRDWRDGGIGGDMEGWVEEWADGGETEAVFQFSLRSL